MSRLLVSVDVGRSSIKSAYCSSKDFTSKGFSFNSSFKEIPSVVSTSYNSFSNPESKLVNLSLDTSVDSMKIISTQNSWNKDLGSLYLFGDTAIKAGSSSKVQFSESEIFHKYSVASILYSVATSVQKSCISDVSLAINLTYTNNQYASFYSQSLKGEHKVELYSVVKGKTIPVSVSFNISHLYCFQQGYSAIFNFLSDTHNYDIVANSKGLIVDIGRYTVDFSLVDKFTLLSGESINYGIGILIEQLAKQAASRQFSLSPQDIESVFLSVISGKKPKTFMNIKGSTLDIWSIATKEGFLDDYYRQISNSIDNFIGSTSIDFVVLCGGGSSLIESQFKQHYKIPILPVSYRQANCFGMLRFLATV